jgi:hypothetical protein
MCTGTHDILINVELVSTRKAGTAERDMHLRQARRRRPEGSAPPKRATQAMRGVVSVAAVAISTTALGARRHRSSRGATSSARWQQHPASPREHVGNRSRRTTARLPSAASDGNIDEGAYIIFNVVLHVPACVSLRAETFTASFVPTRSTSSLSRRRAVHPETIPA